VLLDDAVARHHADGEHRRVRTGLPDDARDERAVAGLAVDEAVAVGVGLVLVVGMQDVVVRLLREKRRTLVISEWATGGLISQWLSDCDCGDVFKIGLVYSHAHYPWRESTQRSISGADYELMVGPWPPTDSSEAAAGTLAIALVFHDETIAKEIPFGGHPEILKPRAAKQALNLLRLHLLGKA